MKKLLMIIGLSIVLLALSACDTASECGTGTTYVDGVCVLDKDVPKTTTGTTLCESEVGPHTVVNGEFTNPPAEPWFFIGGWMVNDPDNIWMEQFGAVVFDVNQTSTNVWDGAFWQPKVYTELGCTYTLSFTMRTDEVGGRDVIVFLEDTDDNYNKFIEDTVTLGVDYQTYTYTFTPLVTNDDTKIGIFFANDIGTVIVDSVLVTREAN